MRVRSGYSFHTAAGHLPEVMARLQAIGYPAAPLSDRVSTFGFTRWTKLAAKAGLKPIYGVELAVIPSFGDDPAVDLWSFFAIESLRPLHDLIFKATSNPGKFPCLSMDQALGATGCVRVAGERLVLERLPSQPAANFYVGLSPSTPRGLVRAAQEAGLPFLAISDNYYPAPADQEFYRIALGSRRANTQTYPMHILSDEEWRDAVPWPELHGAALANRDQAMELCHAQQRKATLLKPEKKQTLREMCLNGAQRKSVNLEDQVYAARLDRELQLIAEKEFEDYFYILADIIGWAKQRMIVGPARGSSCGSLVCYLLDITAIDPIPYGLIFERFIDINRKDLPDIDVDFSDTRRHLVFDYVEKRYGHDKVARLGTVGMFKARSALKQAGASLRIPGWRTDKVLDSLIERSSGDSRAMNTLEDTLNETDAGRKLLQEHPEVLIAARMEGHPNNASQHAAGVIVTNEPIREYVAVDARTRAIMADKKDSEDLNLLKIDALGLTQLSIFERTIELLGDQPTTSWLERIPLDDQKAFDVLNSGHFSGIFQFTGTSVRALAGQIDYRSLDDIIATTAIARPGPLGSGGALAWVRRRSGDEPVSTIHPMLTDLTRDTYGVVIYQETVMRIVREMGQMSWEDTSAIRKAMSGRLGDEFFERYWQKFLVGAVANGVDEDTARAVWRQINTMGSWSFNKSHAVAYGIVSYWCAWFKAHHPIEFAAATLDAEAEPARQLAILRELKAEGVDYVPVDPELSDDRWRPAVRDGRQMLIGPLTSIKGIGPAKLSEIIDCRRLKEPLRPQLRKLLDNAQTPIDSLYPIGDRVKELHPDLSAIKIVTEPTPIIEVQPGAVSEVLIIGVLKTINPRDENEAINVQKRGGKILTGPTQSLNLFVQDDTDEVFCKIDRFSFEEKGRAIVETAKAGRSLYAIKGRVPRDFRMVKVTNVRHLGEMN